MDVKPLPGLEHLPFAEVWLREPDDAAWRTACAAARGIGKDGLEVWTTDETPGVVSFLEARGYEIVRRYVISELDVSAAREPRRSAIPLTTFAARPDLAEQLYAIACEAYPDQPGRAETRLPPFDAWRSWGLDPHPADAYFIALDDAKALGYGYLELDGEQWRNGFLAIARHARGHGLARAIKDAQLVWAKAHGVPTLRTATELRLTQMLALNEGYGYVSLYTEVVLRGPCA